MPSTQYLSLVNSQFKQYRSIAEKAIIQLSDDEIYHRSDAEANSIALIMKHMAGNMISRWTDFLTSDGEKSWRNRDKEFVDPPRPREALLDYWERGWSTLMDTLSALSEDQLPDIVKIRGEEHTVQEAIQRQLAHYAYHVGQIVLLARQFRGKDWQSLSIPRGESEKYNRSLNP